MNVNFTKYEKVINNKIKKMFITFAFSLLLIPKIIRIAKRLDATPINWGFAELKININGVIAKINIR